MDGHSTDGWMLAGDAMGVSTVTELVDIERMGTTLRATDVGGNVVSLDVTGWESGVDAAAFDEPVDAVAAGRVSSMRYDLDNPIRIDRLDGDLDAVDDTPYADLQIPVDDSVTYDLPAGEYRCRSEENLFVNVHIDGEVELAKRAFSPLTFSFSHPTPVTFGFRTMVDYPSHELTVAPTVEGIATGLSHLPSALKTTGPDRVHRDYRGYPPRLTIGDETEIPDAVRESTPETGVELLVSESLEDIVAGASLAYFTGATIRPGDVTTPKLRADAVGLNYEFSSLAQEASELLRRTFFLELLVSWLGSESVTLNEHERLAEAGITLEECEGASLAERLDTYLNLPTEPVDEILPPWPYRMTVAPQPDFVPVLPHLLHDLAAVSPPGDGPQVRESFTDDPVSTLKATRHLHGAVGVSDREYDFTATPTAYENRLRYFDGGSDTLRVRVVVGNEADRELAETLNETYMRRNDNRSLLTDVVVEPTCDELAAVLEQGAQFVHYVGDCSNGTLGCRDGSLDPTTVTDNNVELFVLDSPGADAVAADLVATGSVACATRATGDAGVSLEPDSVDASALLGELLLYGQCLSSAATNSAVLGGVPVDTLVGDATHRFVPRWRPSSLCLLRDTDEGVNLSLVPFSVDPVGAQWIPELETGKTFIPAPFEQSVEPSEIVALIDTARDPLYYDGKLYWGDEQKQLVYPIA